MAKNNEIRAAEKEEVGTKDDCTQYLRLTRELYFDDLCWGRRTTLAKGACGFVLDEKDIAVLPEASQEKRHKMLAESRDACERGFTYALVGGYPCVLRSQDYYRLKTPPFFCIGQLV